MLEVKLITWDGFSFFLMSKFIDNPQAKPTKQDCELNAFHRLAARLKNVSRVCRFAFHWMGCSLAARSFNAAATTTGASSSSCVIVLKEDGLPSVYKEFVGPAKLQPEQKLKERMVKPVELNRNFRWDDGIQYDDSKGREHLLNVIELHESKPEGGQPKTTRFMWTTDLSINKGNLRQIAQNAGRNRWKIENQGKAGRFRA